MVQITPGKGNQTFTIKNTSPHAIGGPFEIAVDNLAPNATLENASGVTSCAAPAGKPVVKATDAPLWLAPGASFSTTLKLKTSAAPKQLQLRVLAGYSAASTQ